MLIETICDNYNLLPALPLYKCSLWWSRAEQQSKKNTKKKRSGCLALYDFYKLFKKLTHKWDEIN